MRPAAELLIIEAGALRPILERTPPEAFARPTVCDGWTVRDVLAHCGAALTRVAGGDLHDFTPADNERDVSERRSWNLPDVLAELYQGYERAASTIDAASGQLDGIGLGEWMHGGDVREALDEPHPYTSAGVELALDLLVERSRSVARRPIAVRLESGGFRFGPGGLPDSSSDAELFTDLETFVRLCGGRRPDPARFDLVGAEPSDLVLFS